MNRQKNDPKLGRCGKPLTWHERAPVWVTGATSEDGLLHEFCRSFKKLGVRHAADALYIGNLVVTTIEAVSAAIYLQRS